MNRSASRTAVYRLTFDVTQRLRYERLALGTQVPSWIPECFLVAPRRGKAKRGRESESTYTIDVDAFGYSCGIAGPGRARTLAQRIHRPGRERLLTDGIRGSLNDLGPGRLSQSTCLEIDDQVECGYKLCPRQTIAPTHDYEAMYIVCKCLAPLSCTSELKPIDDYFPPGNYANRFEENVGRPVA